MKPEPSDDVSAAQLLSSQRAYYDLRAPDYADETKPPDRKIRGEMEPDVAEALIAEFRPTGDVLELACGPGMFTRELVRHARRLTAVDASPRMLARNRKEVGDPTIRYIQADLFAWVPDGRYDEVFFGFWLSHVPPAAFDQFWALVRRTLKPDGRVAFVDEDDRAADFDEVRQVADIPTARRTLSDGRQFDIVKVYWDPAALTARLRELTWNMEIRRVGESFMYGVG